MGYEICLLKPYTKLAEPVSTHCDMLCFVHMGQIYAPADYVLQNQEIFADVNVTPVNADFGREYPSDIRLNVLRLGDTFYGKKDSVCREIIDLANRFVDVKQGYSACSTLVINEKAIVTADRSIARAANENKVQVCLISDKGISLEGYNCGFIGGASVRLDAGTVAFFGNIEDHPDFDKIKAFADQYGVSLVSLSNEPLYDIGSGFVI